MSKCRHCRAIEVWGIMYCPDCGAIKDIGKEYFSYRFTKWVIPNGKEEVLKQLAEIKKYEI